MRQVVIKPDLIPADIWIKSSRGDDEVTGSGSCVITAEPLSADDEAC